MLYLQRLGSVFTEGVMGFLALIALATAIGPLVFDVTRDTERLLTVVEWALVTAFAAEFIVQGATAPDFRAWLRSPWRIIDAVTILGPIVALLPQVSDLASGSLMLRMLRLGRAVAFGTRAGTVVAGKSRRLDPSTGGTPAFAIIGEHDSVPLPADWESVLSWVREKGPSSWVHAWNLDRQSFRELARGAGLSGQDLERLLADDGHGKVREGANCSAFVLQMPTVPERGFPDVIWHRLLAVVTPRGVLTAMTDSVELLELHSSVAFEGTPRGSSSFRARITCALLALAYQRHKIIAERFDDEAHRLEALEEGNELLRRTFRLRREMSAAALDLWHLRTLVRAVADGKTKLQGIDLKDEKFVDDLAGETESLHEQVTELKEDLKSLIELHINLKSFEMNAFLKLLAVVTFLGLIPSVVGGLLGMNVAGNPWPVTIGQVAFCVAMAMATVLYVFAVKEWLK